MIKEFREFIQRGNALDLAVAVILAGAFGLIVRALVDELLNPLHWDDLYGRSQQSDGCG